MYMIIEKSMLFKLNPYDKTFVHFKFISKYSYIIIFS